MRRTPARWLALSLVVLLVCFTGQALAAYDTLIQIPEAPGESKDAKYPGWIDASQYEEHVAGSTRTFAFVTIYNKALPKLIGAAVTGQILRTVTIVQRAAGTQQAVFLNMRFENVRITAVTTGNATDKPQARISFTCDRATWTYYPQKPDGTVDLANPVVVTAEFKTAPPPVPAIEIPRVRL